MEGKDDVDKDNTRNMSHLVKLNKHTYAEGIDRIREKENEQVIYVIAATKFKIKKL